MSTLDQIEAGNPADDPPPKPPFIVPLTAYRLLNISLIIGLGTAKAVLVARDQSCAPSVLEWVMGVIVTVL